MPTVFISYVHSDRSPNDMKGPVLALADRLRAEGVEAMLDQYLPFPPSSWPTWMFRQIQDSDFVLVVGSIEYKRRVEAPDASGRGTGAGWEGSIVTSSIYDDQGTRGTRFVPVVLGGDLKDQVPYFLRETTIYDVTREADFTRLVLHLLGIPAIVPPPVQVPTWTASGGARDATAQSGSGAPPPDATPGVGHHLDDDSESLDVLVEDARRRGWEIRELESHTRLRRPRGEAYLLPRRVKLPTTVRDAVRRDLDEDDLL